MDVDGSFGLSIELTEREHSLDSHSNTYHVLVDGSTVRYHGPYGEGTRGRFPTRVVGYRLSDEQRRTLDLEIDSYDLCQSVEESYELPPDTEVRGSMQDVDLDATLVVDGERYRLRIDGPTRVRGEETGMEHHQQARGIKTLCRRLRDWGEEAGAWGRWGPYSLLARAWWWRRG